MNSGGFRKIVGGRGNFLVPGIFSLPTPKKIIRMVSMLKLQAVLNLIIIIN